jgi:hypothetical protein
MADILPFGEYRPDVSDFNGSFTANLSNVVPRGDGYGPIPSFSALTSTLASPSRGGFYAKNSDGTVTIFAGTATKLYKLSNTDFTWSDVSKAAGSYTSVSSTALWQFEQFNSYVIAVQANAPPQVYQLGVSSAFADLGGSPPQAAYIAIINRFVLLSGLASFPNRIQWCGLNDPTNWTPGTNSSDYQDFADGGPARTCVGGELGFVFQDLAIRRMVYAPGSDVIFNIDRVAKDVGILAPYSAVSAGSDIYFLSTRGFQKISDGVLSPIGRERVDRTFAANWDSASPQYTIGAHAPETGNVFFCYRSVTGAAGAFDSGLVYDPILDRWAPFSIGGQYVLSLARPGVTLEGLDSISSSIDALAFSLDTISNGSSPRIAFFDTANKLGFLTGTPLEATLETGEQGAVNQRLFCQGFYPITDAPMAYGNVTKRENLNAAPTTTTEQTMNGRGFVPARADTRYARGRLRIPAGTAWTYATGVDPLVVQRGKR